VITLAACPLARPVALSCGTHSACWQPMECLGGARTVYRHLLSVVVGRWGGGLAPGSPYPWKEPRVGGGKLSGRVDHLTVSSPVSFISAARTDDREGGCR